jgi:hypothetical protein
MTNPKKNTTASPTEALRPGPQRKRSLTASEFDKLMPWLEINATRAKAARLYLVDGITFSRVAEIIRIEDGHDWSRQNVNDCVASVWRTYQKHLESVAVSTELPEGWVQLTLSMPKSCVDQVHAIIASAAMAETQPAKAANRTRKKPQA